jgi:hypothetical protein
MVNTMPNKYLIIGAAVAGLAVAYMLKKGADKVAEVLEPVNPFNNNNVINQAATGVYQAVTGSAGTIGTDFYDATHGGMLSNGTFNPTSTNNAIYRNIGGNDWSLGTLIYDWTH